MTDSPPNHVLPPASTTKVNLREQAAGFYAQRRTGAPPVTASAPLPEAVQEVYGDVSEAGAPPRPPKPLDQTVQRFTLAQLVERLQTARAHKKAVIESGDPDGPEDVTGWDPGDVAAPPGGASLAAGVIAYQRRQR